MEITTRTAVGISLWWAEGSKSRRDPRWKNAMTYPIEITNTDGKIITVFLDFLRKDIGVNEHQLKLQIQIHEGDNKKELENYWSNLTGIPKERFNKTIVRPVGNKVGKSKGTCKIRFSDKATYNKLQTCLDKVLTGCGAVG